jgi:hypothetical protein
MLMDASMWGNVSRGGALNSAIPTIAPEVATGVLPKVVGALGTVGKGLKFMTGPVGAGIMAANEILKAKNLNVGEDQMMQNINHPVAAAPKTVPPVTNSVTPLAPVVPPANGLGTNPPVALPSLPSALPSQPIQMPIQPKTDLGDILQHVQQVAPVQDYASRTGALNTGNTTWDMNSLDKILAARAGQAADTERYKEQVGALTGLGAAQMQANAAGLGHQMGLLTEREKSRYLAPYHAALATEAEAKAKATPLEAIGKLIQEQNARTMTNKDKLEQATKILSGFGVTAPDPSDPSYPMYMQARYVFDTLSKPGK